MAKSGLFHVYPYREEQKVIGRPDRIPRPTLDIELSLGDQDWRTKALIDTGAPLSVFDHLSAQALGIDTRDSAHKRDKVRIGGDRRGVVLVYVTLALPEFPGMSWTAEAGFFDTEWEAEYGILGDDGFLDHWVVSFNRYRNYFVVEPIEEWEQRMPVDLEEEFKKLDSEWERPTPY